MKISWPKFRATKIAYLLLGSALVLFLLAPITFMALLNAGYGEYFSPTDIWAIPSFAVLASLVLGTVNLGIRKDVYWNIPFALLLGYVILNMIIR